MIFDLFCYATAIVTALAVIGSHKRSVRRVERTIETAKSAIATVEALDIALPEDCFSVDTVAIEIPAPAPVAPATFDCGDRATFDEAMLVAEGCAMVNRYWGKSVTDNVVPFKRPQSKAIKAVSYRNRDELRAHCWSILGTAYDSVGGKRKFWTVARMIEELSLAGWEVNKAA